MFELSDFYHYCKENSVDVIPFRGIPHPGATIRDGTHYAVFLDFSQILSTRLLRGVCCHELGHAATGALHKVSSPYELVERSEYRANRYMAQHFLTQEDFLHKTIDVTGIVDYFSGEYQIKVFTAAEIVVHD